MANPKRPRDPNQRAKLIVDIATGQSDQPKAPKDSAAASYGRSGGKKGGLARASKLPPRRRTEIAKKAAQARWAKAGRSSSR
jgi:hypothetical protein